MEDTGTWFLCLLWHLPQSPKKKIRLFIRFGDYYLNKENHLLSRFCYNKAYQLADSIGAVHYLKKTQNKLDGIKQAQQLL